MKKVALITGISGQDGSYLAELLIEKGYEVHGIVRRHSTINTSRIDHLFENPKIGGKSLFLHHGDLTDSSNLNRLIEKIQPTEIYNCWYNVTIFVNIGLNITYIIKFKITVLL